jgi:hydroxyacylglutathione hydrolase
MLVVCGVKAYGDCPDDRGPPDNQQPATSNLPSRHQSERAATRSLLSASAFTASGLLRLRGEEDVAKFETAFRIGAGARAAGLGDPGDGPGSPCDWLVGGPENEPDAMLNIAGDLEDQVAATRARLRDSIDATCGAIEIVHEDIGNARIALQPGHEHFGFKDGISQPGVRGTVGSTPAPLTRRLLDPSDPLYCLYAAPEAAIVRRLIFFTAVLACASLLAAQPVPGTLPRQWRPSGPKCVEIPEFEVRSYNDDLVILRQSGCTNYEKPFLYLLFGAEKALLLDTGAGNVDVAKAVQAVRAARGSALPLIAAHTHAHGDHIAGDGSIATLPATTVIAPSVDAVKAFFRIPNWPNEIVTFDLGNRILDVIPIPGHEASSIALYDRRTGILFSGDTLYPGRLYIDDEEAFVKSIARLVAFTSTRPIAHILGAHIENTSTPFVDYPIGTTFQPDEHVLELGRAHLLELDEALRGMKRPLVRLALRDFTISP